MLTTTSAGNNETARRAIRQASSTATRSMSSSDRPRNEVLHSSSISRLTRVGSVASTDPLYRGYLSLPGARGALIIGLDQTVARRCGDLSDIERERRIRCKAKKTHVEAR